MTKIKKLFKKQGFTLVELIIVIAIIAVLAVAAFMMLTKWLGKSRDSRRLSDLETIHKGLDVGFTDVDMGNGYYPMPGSGDNGGGVVTLLSGITEVGYQGVVDLEVAKGANLQKVPLDPSDKNEYTYIVTKNRKKSQVLAMLEDGSEVTTMINSVYALDYQNRVPVVKGYNLGVFLSNSGSNMNIPLQYVSGIQGTEVDLRTRTDLKVIIREGLIYTGTSISSAPIIDTVVYEDTGGGDEGGAGTTEWTELDSNCDVADIEVGTQIWAGCNSTLGTGMEYAEEEYCYNYAGANLGDLGDCGVGNYGDSNDKEIDYYNEKGADTTEDIGVDNIWGKLYTWDNSSSACSTGRHVPTDGEWEILEEYLYDQINSGTNDCRDITDGRSCEGLGWLHHTTANNLVGLLKIPLSGRYNGSDYLYRGYSTEIWTSTESGTSAYSRAFYHGKDQLKISILDKTDRLVVRCIKD